MIVSFRTADGRMMRVDLAKYQPSDATKIRENASGLVGIRTKDGKIARLDPSTFSDADAEWLQNNMQKDQMHPLDVDADVFSKEAGVAIRERAAEAFGAALPGKTTTSRIGQAAGKFALGAGEFVSDVGHGVAELAMKSPAFAAVAASGPTGVLQAAGKYAAEKVVPGRKEERLAAAKTIKDSRENVDQKIAAQLDKMGGSDFWSWLGEFTGYVVAGGAVRSAGTKALGVKGIEPIKQQIINAIKNGQREQIPQIVKKFGLDIAKREAVLEGFSGAAIETAKTGKPIEGAKAAPMWAVGGAALGGGGAFVSGGRAAKALLAADDASTRAALKAAQEMEQRVATAAEEYLNRSFDFSAEGVPIGPIERGKAPTTSPALPRTTQTAEPSPKPLFAPKSKPEARAASRVEAAEPPIQRPREETITIGDRTYKNPDIFTEGTMLEDVTPPKPITMGTMGGEVSEATPIGAVERLSPTTPRGGAEVVSDIERTRPSASVRPSEVAPLYEMGAKNPIEPPAPPKPPSFFSEATLTDWSGQEGFIKLPKLEDLKNFKERIGVAGIREIISNTGEKVVPAIEEASRQILSNIHPIGTKLPQETYTILKNNLRVATAVRNEMDRGIQVPVQVGNELLVYNGSRAPMIAWVTKPIDDAAGMITPSGKTIREFINEYIAAKTLSVSANKRKNYVYPSGWSKERVGQIMREHAALPQEIKDVVDNGKSRFFENDRWQLDQDLAHGMISKESYDNIVKYYGQDHAAIVRNPEQFKRDFSAYLGGSRQPKLFVREKMGGTEEIILPLDSLDNMNFVRGVVRKRNKAMSDVVAHIENDPELSKQISLRSLEKPKLSFIDLNDIGVMGANKAENQLLINRDGELIEVTFKNKFLREALEALPPTQFGSVGAAARWYANLKRNFIVNTPRFIQKSVAKTLSDLSVQGKGNAIKPLHKLIQEHKLGVVKEADFWKGHFLPMVYARNVWGLINSVSRAAEKARIKNDLFEEMTSEQASKKYIEDFLIQHGGGSPVGEGIISYKKQIGPYNKVKQLWHELRMTPENAARTAVAEGTLVDMLRRGEPMEKAMRAAVKERQVSGGDYSERGASPFYRGLAQITPFFNATITGLRDYGKAMYKDPLGFSFRMLQYLAIPITNFAVMHNDEEWLARPPYQRVLTSNWFGVPIPRPFGVTGLVSYIVEESLREMYTKSPKETEAYLTALQQFFINTPLPAAADLAILATLGVETFTGKEVVPRDVRAGKPKHLQMNSGTSEIGRQVGQATKDAPITISPAMFDAYIKQAFGPIGQDALFWGGRGLAKAQGGIMPSMHPSDQKFVELYQREKSPMESTSGYVNEVYKARDKVKRIMTDYKNETDSARAQRLIDENTNLLQYADYIDRTALYFTGLNDIVNDIREPQNTTVAPEYSYVFRQLGIDGVPPAGAAWTPEAKANAIAQLNRLKNEAAREVFLAIEGD